MEFLTLSAVRPAHQANQSAMAAEVTDRLWETGGWIGPALSGAQS